MNKSLLPRQNRFFLPHPVCVCVSYLKVQIVEMPQQSKILSTYLTNDIVLKEDGLDEEKSRRTKAQLINAGERVLLNE